MINQIVKELEQIFNRPITSYEFSYIDNWLSKYDSEFINTCIEIAKSKHPHSISYIDRVMFNSNEFYETYKKVASTIAFDSCKKTIDSTHDDSVNDCDWLNAEEYSNQQFEKEQNNNLVNINKFYLENSDYFSNFEECREWCLTNNF